MSNRLNQEREEKLEPTRMATALKELDNRGFEVCYDLKKIKFIFDSRQVVYFPYSGWASGKSIKDGRGLKHLLEQLDKGEVK